MTSKGTNRCPKCKDRERRPGQSYCKPCYNKMRRDRYAKVIQQVEGRPVRQYLEDEIIREEELETALEVYTPSPAEIAITRTAMIQRGKDLYAGRIGWDYDDEWNDYDKQCADLYRQWEEVDRWKE